jgi:hypothetical protein
MGDFPWKAIWKTKVPRKVAFFGLIAAHENFSFWRTFESKSSSLLIGIACVKKRER